MWKSKIQPDQLTDLCVVAVMYLYSVLLQLLVLMYECLTPLLPTAALMTNGEGTAREDDSTGARDAIYILIAVVCGSYR